MIVLNVKGRGGGVEQSLTLRPVAMVKSNAETTTSP